MISTKFAKQFESLSAVSKDTTDAALKLFIGIVMSHEFNYTPEFKRKLSKWLTDSEGFFTRFKFGKRDASSAVKLVLEDKHEKSRVFNSNIESIMVGLKNNREAMKAELDIDKTRLALFNSLRVYYTKSSPSAENAIIRNISVLRDTDLSQMFVKSEVTDASSDVAELEALVKKYGKIKGRIMPKEVLDKWRASMAKTGVKLPEHAEYLRLTAKLRNSYKDFLLNFVRQSGKHTVPVHVAKEAADTLGIPNPLPTGFVGSVDAHGKFYTVAGLEIKHALTGHVTMNPKYDPKKDANFVCMYQPMNSAKPIRAQTLQYISNAKQKNFGKAENVLKNVSKLTNTWFKDAVKAANPRTRTRESVLAALLEFIYQTGARPGEPGQMTKGVPTYGASTIEVRHIIKLDDHAMHVKYQGAKSTEPTDYYIKFDSDRWKKYSKVLQSLIAGKKPSDKVFSFGKNKDGSPHLFKGSELKEYMASVGFPPGTLVKNLRTAKGTGIFKELLKKCPFTAQGDWNDTEVNAWLTEQALKVGAQLGHTSKGETTATTAIQHYISPFAVEEFAKKVGFRLNAKFLKAVELAKGEK